LPDGALLADVLPAGVFTSSSLLFVFRLVARPIFAPWAGTP
jgi:hypothetical protein